MVPQLKEWGLGMAEVLYSIQLYVVISYLWSNLVMQYVDIDLGQPCLT